MGSACTTRLHEAASDSKKLEKIAPSEAVNHRKTAQPSSAIQLNPSAAFFDIRSSSISWKEEVETCNLPDVEAAMKYSQLGQQQQVVKAPHLRNRLGLNDGGEEVEEQAVQMLP